MNKILLSIVNNNINNLEKYLLNSCANYNYALTLFDKINKESKFIWLNAGTAKMLGYTKPDQAIGTTYQQARTFFTEKEVALYNQQDQILIEGNIYKLSYVIVLGNSNDVYFMQKICVQLNIFSEQKIIFAQSKKITKKNNLTEACWNKFQQDQKKFGINNGYYKIIN